jgi:hypothetical protein
MTMKMKMTSGTIWTGRKGAAADATKVDAAAAKGNADAPAGAVGIRTIKP